ncbi:glycosyltransferase [Alphaproteobacteria bacterium]|nr:glycosyltransferase [Alphaproteobacteria bacterium]
MKNKKKILFFLPSFAGGGAEKVTITFVNNLPINDYDIHLTVLNHYGKLKKTINSNIVVHDLKVERLRYGLLKIISNINYVKPDIIFSTFINLNIYLLFCKFFYKNIKFLIRAESIPSTHFKFLPYSKLYRFLYNFFYIKADILIASCQLIYDEFYSIGANKNNIKLIPNPVENISYATKNNIIRQSGEGIRVVAAGRLSEQKGYDYLLEIISKIKSKIHCTILGEGILDKKLKELSFKLNINHIVKFEGYVDNPYPYLKGADALLITSNFEGLPNIALEALYLGTPVIATPSCGGLKELKYVTIVDKGDKFINAVENIKINKNCNKQTLLDKRFNVNNVIRSLIAVLRN